MGRTSVIEHPPEQQLVIIRHDYLVICNGDHCTAAILNVFEHWTNIKRAMMDQAAAENELAEKAGKPRTADIDEWIYMSQPKLQKNELLGLFGEKKVAAGLAILIEKGYLETRNNPRFTWDRTIQYRLNVQKVIDALYTVKTRDAPRQNAATIPKTSLTKKKDSSAPKSGAGIHPPKSRERNPIFDAVQQYIFDIPLTEEINGDGGRIGILASWLEGKSDGGKGKGRNVGFISAPALPAHIKQFADDWSKDTDKPLDLVKFVEHWRKWAASKKKSSAPPKTMSPGAPAEAPVKPLTAEERARIRREVQEKK